MGGSGSVAPVTARMPSTEPVKQHLMVVTPVTPGKVPMKRARVAFGATALRLPATWSWAYLKDWPESENRDLIESSVAARNAVAPVTVTVTSA